LTWKDIAAVFFLAVVVRGAWGAYHEVTRSPTAPAFEFPDEQQYWTIAESIARGDGMRDELGFRASRMPLYPAFLSLFARFDGGVLFARVFHWVIGAIGVVAAASLASQLFGRRVGLTAGVLVAIDPFLVFSSSLLLTETPFILAMLLFFQSVAPLMLRPSMTVSLQSSMVIGLMGALCVYVRVSSLGLVVVTLLLVGLRRRFDQPAFRLIGGSLFLVILTLVPWMLRNRSILGEPVWLTTRAGISLFDGVGPQADGTSDLGTIKTMPEVAELTELQWNRYFIRRALEAMKDRPGRIAKLALVKIGRMWNPVPNVKAYRSSLVRMVAAAWSIPIFALAIVGCMILPSRRDPGGLWVAGFLLLPAIYFTALHSVFVGSVRYRLAAVVTLEILAAVAILAAWNSYKNHKQATALEGRDR